MKVHFLSADKPIVKEYELNSAKELVKHSYPFVYEVTSHEVNVANLADLHKAITKHSLLGNCLVKGELGRQLVAESRKGATNPDDKTEWICLDLDGIDNYQT